MPPEEQGLDLEQLKVDPRVWQRLATPLDGSNVLGNVFVNEKENPFQKDPKGSMEKIQSLAAAGKLYLRDLGRSRHFHKVEKDGDNLKLGEKHEMKLSNRNMDLPLSILMWATGKYLRSWGLERIPNWFDKKREERAAINKMEARYKEEYKSLTSEQKKELKDLRKQEKQEAKAAKQEAKLQKKLEKLKKEAEKTQKNLDKLKNKNKEKSEEKPKKKAKKKTGRKNKKEIKEKESDQLTKDIKKETQEIQDSLSPPENPNLDKETGSLIDEEAITQKEGVLITEDGELIANEEIEHQVFPNQEENPNRVSVTENLQDVFKDFAPQPQQNLPQQPQQEGAQGGAQGEGQGGAQGGEQGNGVEEAPVELPFVDFTALQKLDNATIHERLAEEKQAMDKVSNWRDTVAKSLFGDGEGTVAKTIYDKIKVNGEAEFDYLSSAVFGLLGGDAGGPENKQQIMDKLLNGQPLGKENNDLVMDGITEYEKQTARLNTQEGRKAFAQTLADVTLELSKQASRETNLSPRHVMIGRLISNAMTIADNHNLALPLKQDDWTIIRGAFNMANLSQDYHNARQYLGSKEINLDSERGRTAVNTLLAGQAVEKMLQRDREGGQEITSTQIIMGSSVTWSSKNLQKMVNHSEMRKGIDLEQVKTLLEEPNGFAAFNIGKKLSQEILAEVMGIPVEKDYSKQKQMEKENVQQQPKENEQQMEQPNINLFNPFG